MDPGPLFPLLLLLGAAASALQPGPSLSTRPGDPSPRPEDASYADHCLAPSVTGPCRASFPRWFYSPGNRSCRPFTYGGCRGNHNNYPSRELCLLRCQPPPRTGDSLFPGKELALGLLGLLTLALGLAFGVTALRRPRPPPRSQDKESLMGRGPSV